MKIFNSYFIYTLKRYLFGGFMDLFCILKMTGYGNKKDTISMMFAEIGISTLEKIIKQAKDVNNGETVYSNLTRIYLNTISKRCRKIYKPFNLDD